ncbi:FAD/NAD(P)-binding domain-containing protein [Stipitochalara longipes BDJ]|nr:FAD/NAD(P)-binding domain-containing protein [Stipitochalara longipes BDJ]
MAVGFPKIAIIGAGVAGLALACFFHQNGIPYTIYEAEEHLTSRKQGGPVNVHYDTGERILRALGLFERYKTSTYTPGCEVNSVGNRHGKLLLHHSEEGGISYPGSDSPLVDRVELRRLVLSAIPADTVHWGSKVKTILAAGDNTYDITFSNGSSETGFHLIVGADGAWSRVRSLLTETTPTYTGLAYLETEIQDLQKASPEILRLIQRGSYYYLDSKNNLVVQRDGDRTIWIYPILQKPEEWIKNPDMDLKDVAATKKRFVEEDWKDWTDELKDIISSSDTEFTPRGFYTLPIGHKWEHRAGLTLVGDAAHLMTPHGGMGANSALMDGYDLGEAIMQTGRKYHWETGAKFVHQGGLSRAVQRYEDTMFPRSELYATKTARNRAFFQADDAAEKLVGLTKSMETF